MLLGLTPHIICVTKVNEYGAKLRRDNDTKNDDTRMLSMCVDHNSLSDAREKAAYRTLQRGTVREILVALGDSFSAETEYVVAMVLTKAEWIRNGGWNYPKVTPSGHNFADAFKSTLPKFSGVVNFRDERPSSGVYRTEIRTERCSNVTQRPQCDSHVVDVPPAQSRIDPTAPTQECTNVVKVRKIPVKVSLKRVKGGTKRKGTAVLATTEKRGRRGKMPKTSNDTIPDVEEHGPWTALENPFIGLANVGSEGTLKRRISTLADEVIFAWKAVGSNAANPHAV